MKSIKILRFGKLLPVEQTGNFGIDGYHNAPEKDGFYCFNNKFIELFLVGEKMYERDIYHGEIVDGYLWTHLTPKKRNLIIEQKGSWNKIRVQDYNKILKNVFNTEVTCYEDGYIYKYAKDHLEIFCTHETVLKNVKRGFNKYKSRGVEKSNEIWEINDDRYMSRWNYYQDLIRVQKEKHDESCKC